MRTSVLLLCAVALGACAGEPEPLDVQACLARVETLEAKVRAKAPFDEVFDAYKSAKELVDRDEEDGPCRKAYAKVQANTERALQRDNLSVMGWIMGFFAASVLWGGCWVCIGIAMKRHQIEETAEHASEV